MKHLISGLSNVFPLPVSINMLIGFILYNFKQSYKMY